MMWDQFIALCNPTSATGKLETVDGRVQHDSRKIKPGDIFVAVTGLNADGHHFIPKALENGAKVIIAEHEVTVPNDVSLLIVDNSRVLLNKLALATLGDPQKKLRFIGVTGTNGKTTVT
ncbi:MAG TPA: Mur ligase domain-containing protein, partial [Balneolales bacterium]|nr:Mur ligase domain-containing protein [Balneolales bacterium]